MRFIIQVEVELERTEGKFASRDEMSAQIIEAIEGADPSSLDGDNGGVYEVIGWDVTDASEDHKPPKRAKRPERPVHVPNDPGGVVVQNPVGMSPEFADKLRVDFPDRPHAFPDQLHAVLSQVRDESQEVD